MSPEEILALFAGDPKRICARVDTDGGGRIRTRATAAGLILTAALTLPTTPLVAQSPKPAAVQNARTRHVKGTGVYGVVSDDGTPLSGVKVTVTRSGDNREASAVTGPDGTYSFTNLAPGDYELSFTRPLR